MPSSERASSTSDFKNFVRASLTGVSFATDQTMTVTVVLDRHAFSYYDEAKGDWAVEPGSYTVEVGSSSRNILLTGAVDVD